EECLELLTCRDGGAWSASNNHSLADPNDFSARETEHPFREGTPNHGVFVDRVGDGPTVYGCGACCGSVRHRLPSNVTVERRFGNRLCAPHRHRFRKVAGRLAPPDEE